MIRTNARTKSEAAQKKRKSPPRARSYRSRQPSLFESHSLDAKDKPKLKKEWQKLSRRTHGGSIVQGKRKESRPLNSKKWLHLILKSSQAKGQHSLLKPAHQIFIAKLIEKKARKFGIKIHSQANVGNHLHLKLKFEKRNGFQDFLRSVTAQIARQVTGARKGKPFGKFWDALAYTRVVTTRKEELKLRGYIEGNVIEATISKAAREEYLAKFNAWVESLTGG